MDEKVKHAVPAAKIHSTECVIECEQSNVRSEGKRDNMMSV